MARKLTDNKYITDPEFISEFAREIGVSPNKAKIYVKAFTECVRRMIVTNGVLNIRKLGLFQTRLRKKGKARNIRTGQEMIIPVMLRILFKPALSLKQAANERVKRDQKEKLDIQ